ncbi:MAG TPA: NADH-quinone oxidoreductase subunit N [Acidimicrobiales bacterium]|nr:NADH-quinone oxidoreductase subunit N [Acidimicrobiales bacterium]
MSPAAATTAVHHVASHAAAAGIGLPAIRYLSILPVIVMLGGAVLLLGLASLVRRPLRLRMATISMVAISGTAFGLAWWQWADVQSRGPTTSIDHAVVMDGFSVLVTVLVTAASILSALVGEGYLSREGVRGVEFHVLALVSASGAILMAQANDLIIVFLGLEILSIALYVLTAFNHRRSESGEAALKYFVLGGFSSAIFVYGIALTYGATGTTNLTQIADFLAHNVLVHDGVLLAGLSLLLVGFAFKVAAVPFHMWTPDVYQGAPSPVTGFMAAVAKAGGFAAFLRVFISSFGVLQSDWRPIIYALAIVTLLVGAGLAVVQRDIKRMLAYSSINHAGFILVGLQAATARGVSAALYYLFAYVFMVIGSFAVVTLIGGKGDRDHDLSSYRGLARRQPLLAFVFAVLLLAQAGVPFTTGFLTKFQIVIASVDAHSVPLAVVAMVSAALAAFFYLRVTVLMYGPEDGTLAPRTAPTPVLAAAGTVEATRDRLNAALLLEGAVPASGAVAVGTQDEVRAAGRPAVAVPALAVLAIGICVAVTVVFGIIPAPLVDFAHRATLLFVP